MDGNNNNNNNNNKILTLGIYTTEGEKIIIIIINKYFKTPN